MTASIMAKHNGPIDLLRKDMRGEHQAIIQYLRHAYAMGEGEIACEVEAIAREEMRHLDWLADLIVELGGDPTMERDPVDMSPGTPAEQLLKDVDLEQVAIDQYRAHIDAIDHPKVRRVLSRILHDELVHKGQFRDLAEEARAEDTSEGGKESGAGLTPRTAAILNQGIRDEYSAILQYLYHSFVSPDKELAEEMSNTAINEMQHMGWFSEEVAARGGDPDMSHHDLVLTRDHRQMLEAGIAAERAATKGYTEQIPELDDPDLQNLVERTRDHEIHHVQAFQELLEKVVEKETGEGPAQSHEAPQDAPPRRVPSVGSLKNA